MTTLRFPEPTPDAVARVERIRDALNVLESGALRTSTDAEAATFLRRFALDLGDMQAAARIWADRYERVAVGVDPVPMPDVLRGIEREALLLAEAARDLRRGRLVEPVPIHLEMLIAAQGWLVNFWGGPIPLGDDR